MGKKQLELDTPKQEDEIKRQSQYLLWHAFIMDLKIGSLWGWLTWSIYSNALVDLLSEPMIINF